MSGTLAERTLQARLLKLADDTAKNAERAIERAAADPHDPHLSLSVKNWNSAALSATQAWMTATRQDGRR